MVFTKTKAPQRIYVRVSSDIDPTGCMIPRAIIWNDGRVFEIEKVISYYPAASTEKGMSGNCYTVIIRGKTRMLYFQRSPKEYISQTGRWYVEVPA